MRMNHHTVKTYRYVSSLKKTTPLTEHWLSYPHPSLERNTYQEAWSSIEYKLLWIPYSESHFGHRRKNAASRCQELSNMLKFCWACHIFSHLQLHHLSNHFGFPDSHMGTFQNRTQRHPWCLQFLVWGGFHYWLWFARCSPGCLGIFWGRRDWWWRRMFHSTGPAWDTLRRTTSNKMLSQLTHLLHEWWWN